MKKVLLSNVVCIGGKTYHAGQKLTTLQCRTKSLKDCQYKSYKVALLLTYAAGLTPIILLGKVNLFKFKSFSQRCGKNCPVIWIMLY